MRKLRFVSAAIAMMMAGTLVGCGGGNESQNPEVVIRI